MATAYQLQASHHPKYERHTSYTFVILRHFDRRRPGSVADTVKELTHKAAMFPGEEFIILPAPGFYCRRVWNEL